MPLFEYICQSCGRKFTWLVGVVASSSPPTCDRCGVSQATRKEVSRFAKIRSEEDAINALADPSGIGDPDDPRSMRRWAKDMGSELGEDLGDEFDEYMDGAEGEGADESDY